MLGNSSAIAAVVVAAAVTSKSWGSLFCKYFVLKIYRSGNIPKKCPSQKSGFWADLKIYGSTNSPTVLLANFPL